MRLNIRSLSILGATTLAICGLTACGGGGGDSDRVVARITGGGTITKADVEHWMPVEAVVLYQEYPTKPVPEGVVPDPPTYTACVAYLQTSQQKLVESGPKPSTTQLKNKCAAKNKELKELTLNTLIVWNWTIDAGLALGMKASDAEVKARFNEGKQRYFPKGEEFANYLMWTGQTVSDIVFRSRVQVFEAKLLKDLEAIQKNTGLTAQQKREALAKFMQALPPGKQWAAKTTCVKGYVVSACKQYNGPLEPGVPN